MCKTEDSFINRNKKIVAHGVKENSNLALYAFASTNKFETGLLANLKVRVSDIRKVQQANHPPEVKIVAPENNSFFDWNSKIEYTIKVSDKEDGESDKLDIPSHEVFMEVVYLPDASMVKDYTQKQGNTYNSPGFYLLKVSDCFNCHAVKTRLQGPSFDEITKRYPNNPATVKMLATRVIEGSSGNWGISAMASHPDLTMEQAGQIVQWIFDNAGDPNRNYYSGLRGSIQIKNKPENETGGVYLLTASYTDHGLKNSMQMSQTGQHTIMLRNKLGK